MQLLSADHAVLHALQNATSAGAAAAPAPAVPAKRRSAPVAAAPLSPSKRARLQLESPTKRAQLNLPSKPPVSAPAEAATVQLACAALQQNLVQPPKQPPQLVTGYPRQPADQPAAAAGMASLQGAHNSVQGGAMAHSSQVHHNGSSMQGHSQQPREGFHSGSRMQHLSAAPTTADPRPDGTDFVPDTPPGDQQAWDILPV